MNTISLTQTRMPWSQTQAFPHPLANVHATSSKEDMMNYLSDIFVELSTWEGLGDVINSFRSQTLGLKPLNRASGPTVISQLRIPYTYCWWESHAFRYFQLLTGGRARSQKLIEKPQDWGAHISVTGLYSLPPFSQYTPPTALEEFLHGEPPIYIGFGPVVVDDPKKLTLLLLEAVRLAGVRAIISQGWGELGSAGLAIPPNVYLLGNCPHTWIFQEVSCVVHHGGAGTIAAAIAAGKPSVVIPFFGDQPFWGAAVAKIGAGPRPITFRKLAAPDLAVAISAALEPETIQRVRVLREQIHEEHGVDTGVLSFHNQVRHSDLTCSIVSTHAAAWKVRNTNIRLNSTAATILIDRDLLDIDKIELYVYSWLTLFCLYLQISFSDFEPTNMIWTLDLVIHSQAWLALSSIRQEPSAMASATLVDQLKNYSNWYSRNSKHARVRNLLLPLVLWALGKLPSMSLEFRLVSRSHLLKVSTMRQNSGVTAT